MTEKDTVKQLQEKFDQNMREYQSELLCLTPSQLIDRAEEIAAAKVVCETFRDFGDRYQQEELERLLQVENPLEMMRDQWLSEQDVDIHQEMGHALWNLVTELEADLDAPIDRACEEPDRGIALM